MKHLLTLIPLVLALSASTASAQQGPQRGQTQPQPQQCDCDCHLQGQQQGQRQAQRGSQQGQPQTQRGQQQGQRGKSQGAPRGGDQRPSREQMLKDFDIDGDGRLNEEERSAARAVRMYQMRMQQMEEGRAGEQRGQHEQRGQQGRRGQQGTKGQQQGQQQDQRSPQQDRTQDATRAERHAAILKRFDTDGDGVLNAAERTKARAEMGARRSQPKRNAQGGATQGSEEL